MNKLETIKLDNGLTIYLYKDTRRHSTLFQFVTKFGGLTKDFLIDGKEYHFCDGIAHILEHYTCECSKHGNVVDILRKKQMGSNAATYNNMTLYFCDAVENINFGINKILGAINEIDFTAEKLEKIKNPIYQEIRGKSDNKFYHLNNMMRDNLFNNITFKNIGGTVEDVENTTIEDIKVCYEAFYQPSNQFIVVAGNFDKDDILKTIKNFYKKINHKKHDVKLLTSHEGLKVKKEEEILYYKTPKDYIRITYKIDISKYSMLDRMDISFYINCFIKQYFGVNSKIYKDFKEKKIINNFIGCNTQELGDFILLSIGDYTDNIEYFRENVINTIKNIDNFDEELFNLDKDETIIHLILRDDSLAETISPLIGNIVYYDYPYLDEISDTDRLTFDTFKKVIKNIDFSNYTVGIIKDTKKES